MKGSLIIIGFFILGTLCGFFHLIPFDISKSNISFYALCALMFSVGLSVGHDPQTLKNFRSLNPRLIFLPVATILGTVSAAALVSLIPHRSGMIPKLENSFSALDAGVSQVVITLASAIHKDSGTIIRK